MLCSLCYLSTRVVNNPWFSHMWGIISKYQNPMSLRAPCSWSVKAQTQPRAHHYGALTSSAGNTSYTSQMQSSQVSSYIMMDNMSKHICIYVILLKIKWFTVKFAFGWYMCWSSIVQYFFPLCAILHTLCDVSPSIAWYFIGYHVIQCEVLVQYNFSKWSIARYF